MRLLIRCHLHALGSSALVQEGSITTVFVAHDWNTVQRLTGAGCHWAEGAVLV